MKKIGRRILSLVLVVCMIAPSIIAVAKESKIEKFTDFPDDWSTQAVTAAVNNGLLHGYDDNTIRAEGLLTRAEMATVINNAFGAVIKADISAYKDVSPDAWYYDEIAKGVNMGTFIGAGDGYMYPDNPITREETFVVIARALVLSDEDTTSLDKFTDKSSVSSWAINAIAALAARGYVNGDEASRVTPNNNITRAEFATLMDNIVKKYYSAEGTYTGTIDGSVMINVGGVTLSNMVINGDLIIGDGVHTGEIRLENVKINGRIIVRGAQKPGKIYIIRSSVRDGVVVNNVNGTVYFDNYQSEVIFKNMLSNTPAEFKKPSSGGGSSSSSSSSRNKLTVTFVLATDLSGNPTNTKVYKVSKGKTLKEQMGEDFVMPTANITYTQDRDSTNEYSHDVSQTGWFSEGRNEYTTDTKIESDVTLYPGWKDFSAKVKTERFNVQGFNGIDISTYYEPNGRVIDAATDLVFANRGRVIKSLSLAEDKVFERPEIQRFITPDKQIKMTNLDMSFKDIFGSTANFKSLFQTQIDEAMKTVPESMRADVEAKIDEALVQIAEKKVWNLRQNNTIGINMPLRDIFGGADSLRTMLKDATDGALESVPDSMRDQIQDELDNVIEFIVASEPNESLDKDKYTNIEDRLALNEFFGGKDDFADMLKTEAEGVITSNVPANMQDDVRTALYEVIDDLAGKTVWDINATYATKGISTSITLSELFGGEAAFAQMMKKELDAAIVNINDEVLKAQIKNNVGSVIDVLANKTEWSLNDVDGKTTINIKKSVPEILGGVEAMQSLIKGEINGKLADVPEGVKNHVTTPIYSAVDTLVGKNQWQVDDPEGKTDVQIGITLDDIFGGDGEFADAVNGAIANDISVLSDDNKAAINGAIDNIAAAGHWSKNSPEGNVNLKFEIYLSDVIGNDRLGTLEGLAVGDDNRAVIDAIRNGSEFSVTNENKDFVQNYLLTAIQSATVEVTTIPEINKAIQEGFVSETEVAAKINAAKLDYERTLQSAINNAQLGDPVKTVISVPERINISERFLKGMEVEISAIVYDADVKPKLDNLLGTDLIEMVGASNIKTAFDSAKVSYLQDIQLAIENPDNSVGDTISIEIKVDVTKLLLEGLSAKIEDYKYDRLKKDGYIQEALIAVVGEETLKTAVNGAISAYKDAIDAALENSSQTLTNEISIDVDVNVNKIILVQMETKISDISFDDVKDYEAIKNILDSGLIDKTTLEGAFKDARDAYAAKVSEVVNGTPTTLDNEVALEVKVNMVDLIIKALGDWLTDKTYDDVKDKINVDSSIEEALGDKLEEEVNKALDEYRKRIKDINDGRSTKFDTSYTLTIDINITELVINGLIGELDPLTYADIKDDLGEDMVKLLGDDYLSDQFDIVKKNMIKGIEEAIDPESDKGLTGDIFRLKLGLDVYSLLLKQIDKQIGNMSYGLVSDKIPEQIKKVLGEEIIKAQYDKVINDFGARVDDAVAAIERGDAEVILDCTLRISINLIDEIIKPLYERYLAKAEDKLGTYYTENEYLVAIKELLTPDNLLDVDGVATDELSGYKLRDYDDYYDILEKVVLLSDKAITQFSTDVSSEKKEELVSTYVDLSYDYYDRIVELARTALTYIDKVEIDIDSVLPSREAMEEKKQSIKDNAVLIVKNPDLTAKEAFEKAFEYIDVIDGRDGIEISANATWGNFVITIKKAEETITIKNRTSIPEIE